jgi:hypothetical protein
MDLQLRKSAVFQEEALPAGCSLAGLSALVEAFSVRAPVRYPACVSELNIKGHVKEHGNWRIYDKRHQLESTVEAHLNFAMRYEHVDLLVLKRIFLALPPEAVVNYIESAPTSTLTRRAWYLYELLTEKTLPVPDAANGAVIDLLDTDKYFTRPNGVQSRRHKVRDNLLGTTGFCPIIRRTDALVQFVNRDLSASARKTIGHFSKAVIARAASFLLLADSQASFQIEGERPRRNRIERWGRAVMQAGKVSLTQDELIRLHGILIEDNRFVQPGLRKEGVFLGEHTVDGEPLPEFIGARPADLQELTTSLLEANAIMRDASIDAVLQAAATAFGFIYVHPFEDGNGRLHRCLIHHALAERRFTPPGLLFPVSSVMLDWIDLYRETLKAHSAPLMPFIEWTPTAKGNVEVTNDTADLYRYYDCTEAAEFLYRCVERTIDVDLPREIDYLTRRDEALRNVMNLVEMPDRQAEQFILFVHRNNGKLPNRRRKEFAALTEDEVEKLEEIVRDAFDGYGDPEPSDPK